MPLGLKGAHVRQLCITVTKIPDENNLEEKRFILVQFSEDSVHGWLAPLLWA